LDPEQRRNQSGSRSGERFRLAPRCLQPWLKVDASVKLAKDLSINQTPTLVVNWPPGSGQMRLTTPSSRSFCFQEKLDGLSN